VPAFARFANGSTPFPTLMLNEVLPAGADGSLSYNGILYPAFKCATAQNPPACTDLAQHDKHHQLRGYAV
jgi:hypothetical protein